MRKLFFLKMIGRQSLAEIVGPLQLARRWISTGCRRRSLRRRGEGRE
jgi:hypothetical protein